MLNLNGIVKYYKIDNGNDVLALDDINFTFKDNGLYFLLGKSGSGKSTLLNIIGGLDKASEGDIYLNDNKLSLMNNKELDNYRNSLVGFVFQEYNLIEKLNVIDNVKVSLEFQGKSVTNEEIIDVLKKVGIEELAYRKVNELSGGQKQRVSIARAIIKKPRIILADEPTGSLDSTNSKEIFSLLKELSKEYLVIVVSHDEEYANSFGDCILRLEDGKLIDTIINNTLTNKNVEVSIKNNKIKLLSSIKLAFKNLNIKIYRTVILALLLSFSLVLVGVSLSFYFATPIDIYVKNYEEYNYKQDIGFISYGLPYQEYENAMNKASVKLYPVYYPSMKKLFQINQKIDELYDDDTYIKDCYHADRSESLVIHDQSIVNELGFTLYGKYPSNHLEVAITDYLYESIKEYGFTDESGNVVSKGCSKDDVLGKTISIDYSSSPLTITGIIDTNYDIEEYSFLKNINLDHTTLENRLVWNMISRNMNSVSTAIYMSEAPQKEVTIYDDNGKQTGIEIIKMSKDYIFCISTINPKNNDIIKKLLIEMIGESGVGGEYKFQVFTNSIVTSDQLNIINVYKNISLFLGVVFAVISSLLMFIFLSQTIKKKQKEIGIMKALGAKRKDISIIFSSESLIIFLSSIVVTYISLVITTILLNNHFINEFSISFNFLELNILVFIILFVFALFITFLASLLPIIKLNKSNPIYSLNEK